MRIRGKDRNPGGGLTGRMPGRKTVGSMRSRSSYVASCEPRFRVRARGLNSTHDHRSRGAGRPGLGLGLLGRWQGARGLGGMRCSDELPPARRAGAVVGSHDVQADQSGDCADGPGEHRHAGDAVQTSLKYGLACRPGHRRRRLVHRQLPDAVQVLLLGVHAIDLARAPAQERHAITAGKIASSSRIPRGGGRHACGRKPRQGGTRPPAACARMGIAVRSSVRSSAGVPGNAYEWGE